VKSGECTYGAWKNGGRPWTTEELVTTKWTFKANTMKKEERHLKGLGEIGRQG
jgi:hypothetical protein